MAKKKSTATTVEQFVADAEARWMRAYGVAQMGQINLQQVAVAMEQPDNAHKQAIKENKRYLIS